jgi:hypothetical protein
MRKIKALSGTHHTKDFYGFVKFDHDLNEDDLESFGILCLNPSYIFRKLIKDEHPRSLLLTSGTLNPLDLLKSEL